MEFSMVVQQLMVAADKLKEEKEELNKRRATQNAQKKNAYNKQRGKSNVDIDDDEDDGE